MTMRSNEVIAPTTSAAQFIFSCFGTPLSIGIDEPGLTGFIDILFNKRGTDEWLDTGITLDTSNRFITFTNSGIFKLDKKVTTNAVGVYMSGDFNHIKAEDLS